jgi:hypothetical protein
MFFGRGRPPRFLLFTDPQAEHYCAVYDWKKTKENVFRIDVSLRQFKSGDHFFNAGVQKAHL